MAPDRVGAGSWRGQRSARIDLPVVTRIRSPAPPPDSASPAAVARGLTTPPGAATSVGSAGTQPVSRRTRTGRAAVSVLSVPSGLAKVVAVSVRSPVISTRWPPSRAASRAETRSGFSADALVVAAPTAARAGGVATWTVTRPEPTTASAVAIATAVRAALGRRRELRKLDRPTDDMGTPARYRETVCSLPPLELSAKRVMSRSG